YLEREPNNEFDKNAIKVLINNIHVGYIPKKKAKKIAKLIDNGYNYRAELSIDECFYQKGDDIYVTIFIFDTESLPIIPPKTVKTLDGDIVYLSDNKESTDSYDCPQEDCEPKVSEIDESEIQRACVGCLLILILTCLFIYFLFR
ncbi:HIRAN domain-containing protein, partial [Streptococcus pyogenes]